MPCPVQCYNYAAALQKYRALAFSPSAGPIPFEERRYLNRKTYVNIVEPYSVCILHAVKHRYVPLLQEPPSPLGGGLFQYGASCKTAVYGALGGGVSVVYPESLGPRSNDLRVKQDFPYYIDYCS